MKTNKTILFLVLAVLAFSFSPSMASARVIGGSGQYLLVSDPYIPPTPQPQVLGTSTKRVPTVVTKAPTKKKVAQASVSTKSATNIEEVNEGMVEGASDSNLSANVASSGAGFMPDTLLEWIFLFILILLGVKLWRHTTVTEKEKHAPLKHA